MVSRSISASEETWAGTREGAQRSHSEAAIEGYLQAGAQLDRYTVLERVGSGASGVVYSAYHPALDRKVAVKVLLGSDATSEHGTRRQRFMREAQAMARLSHRNVVTVHDVGVFDGRPFIVMEYVDGFTLAQWIREASPSVAEIVEVFVAAGRGLAAIHADGLIHRDFKPDNVMVATNDRDSSEGKWHVRVMDLGVARLAEAEDEAQARANISVSTDDPPSLTPSHEMVLTAHGALIGTPAYMAPEQLRGGSVDARADQFSFCVSLWEAAFGKRPFAGGTPTEAFAAMTEGRIETPTVRDERGRQLLRVLERGLSVDPGKRWADMASLLEELERDPTRPRRVVAWGLATVALIAAGVAIPSMLERQQVAKCEESASSIDPLWSQERRDAISKAILATELPFAQGTVSRLDPKVSEYVDTWRRIARQTCIAAEVDGDENPSTVAVNWCLDRTMRELDEFLTLLERPEYSEVSGAISTLLQMDSPARCRDDDVESRHRRSADRASSSEVRASLMQAERLQGMGRNDEALAIAHTVLDQAEASGWTSERAHAAYLAGSIESVTQLGSRGRSLLREAFRLALESQQWELAIDAALEIGQSIATSGESTDKAAWWIDVAQALLSNVENPGVTRTWVRAAHGRLALIRGQYDLALREYEEALRIVESEVGAEHPYSISIIGKMAEALLASGQHQEALRLAQRQLDLRISMLGGDHPSVAMSLRTLTDAQRKVGDLEGALHSAREALSIVQRSSQSEAAETAQSEENLGLILWEMGRGDEAEHHLSRALEIGERAFGSDHPEVALLLLNMANVHHSRARYDEAIELQRRALKILQETRGPEHPDVGILLSNMGNEMNLAGDPVSALQAHQKALEITRKSTPDNMAMIAAITVNIAEDLMELRRYDEALSLLQQSLEATASAYGPEHFETAYPWQSMAELHLRRGQLDEALLASRRALKLRERSDPNIHRVATSRFLVAEVLAARGDVQDARAQARRALQEHGDGKEAEEIRTWLEDLR